MNFKELRLKIQYFVLGRFLSLYKLITIPLATHKYLFVNYFTDIMIEGYPRSGNTFAVAAFIYAQNKAGKNIKIARHRHEIAQVLLAIEYRIPTLLLIREPLEAVSSFIIREQVSPEFALKYYIYYYQHLMAVRKDIVIGEFIKVITNFGEIIKMINEKYGKKFAVFEYTPESLEEVKKIIEKMEFEDSGGKEIRITHVAFPTEERKKMKQKVKNYIKTNKKLIKLLNQAQEVYKEFLKT